MAACMSPFVIGQVQLMKGVFLVSADKSIFSYPVVLFEKSHGILRLPSKKTYRRISDHAYSGSAPGNGSIPSL